MYSLRYVAIVVETYNNPHGFQSIAPFQNLGWVIWSNHLTPEILVRVSGWGTEVSNSGIAAGTCITGYFLLGLSCMI